MIPLSATSARLVGAQRFGNALRATMKARGVGQVRLSEAVHVSPSAIGQYRMGRNVPTIEVAQRLADALMAPELVTLARAARTIPCETCKRPFPVEAGSPRRFCTEECRRVASKKRPEGGVATRERAIAAERSLAVFRDAVRLMCEGCEPSGICHTTDCPLRIVSPIPLAVRKRDAGRIRDRRGVPIEVIRAANAKRWTDEERERQSQTMRDRFASMSDAERSLFSAKVSAGRRAKKAA